METEETLPEEMPTQETPQEVPDGDWWVDPLVVIETVSNCMYSIADAGLDAGTMLKINDDMTSTLFYAHKLLRIKLKQQIKEFNKSE